MIKLHTHVALYALDLEVANDERVRERLTLEGETQLLPDNTCTSCVSQHAAAPENGSHSCLRQCRPANGTG